jgi:hypothetical protein
MNPLAGRKGPQVVARHHGDVIDFPDIFAAVLMLIAVAVFAAMIYAGRHQH